MIDGSSCSSSSLTALHAQRNKRNEKRLPWSSLLRWLWMNEHPTSPSPTFHPSRFPRFLLRSSSLAAAGVLNRTIPHGISHPAFQHHHLIHANCSSGRRLRQPRSGQSTGRTRPDRQRDALRRVLQVSGLPLVGRSCNLDSHKSLSGLCSSHIRVASLSFSLVWDIPYRTVDVFGADLRVKKQGNR